MVFNRMLDGGIRWMTRAVLWKPKDNAPTRMFTAQIALSLKQKEMSIHAHEWRSRFFEKHKGWFLQTLDTVFTPRSVQRYRPRLRALYQQVLNLQPPHVYRKPVLPPEEPKKMLDDDASDDVSEAAKEIPLTEDDVHFHPPMRLALPWPMCGLKGPQDTTELPDGVQTHLAQNFALAWHRVAQARVAESRLAEQWKRHLRAAGECQSCGVRADDPAVFREDSLWGSAGPCLRVVETQSIYNMLDQYDGSDEEEWRQLLEDDCWSTLCWRCANLQGLRQAPGVITAGMAGSDLSSSA